MGSTQSTWGYKPKNFKPQHFYNQQLLRSFYSTDLNLAHTKQTPPPIQTPQTSANMVRGEASIVKCHYKGKTEDFVIFVDDVESAEKWKTDKSIPLAQVVSSFKVFVSKQGKQGPLDGASNQTLETEFGTSQEGEVIKQIIEKGAMQETEGMARQGTKNDSMGARAGH